MMKVLVIGIAGKMGRAMTAGLCEQEDMEIVGAVDVTAAADIAKFIGGEPRGIPVEDDLASAVRRLQPDVLLDFTNPQAVRQNIAVALEQGVDMLVGTTGFSDQDIAELHKKAQNRGIRLYIVPNFALGAVLMMQFAAQAARYFPHAEIIELHHDQKMDAPSGTAAQTLARMAANREHIKQGNPDEFEKIAGARGGEYEGMRVHSVRLPGFVAHQEVIFGSTGQTLTIRHDSMSRESFLPGVLLALRNLDRLEDGVTVGLDVLL